ncbi:hypothetical protein C8Q75DRAFT_783650 [Abortiporus biennis]|nr:hypothetical protein C8Q75DRAFT_783650 [Abortiporus biennis]
MKPSTHDILNIQDYSHTIEVQFRVDNLKRFFEPQTGETVSLYTSEPLAGYFIINLRGSHSKPGNMRLYLRTRNGYPHSSLRTQFFATATSLCQTQTYTKKSFSSAKCLSKSDDQGFNTFLTLKDWKRTPLMREQNAMLLFVKIQAPPSGGPKPTLMHRLILSETLNPTNDDVKFDMTFHVYGSCSSSSGTLKQPRLLHANEAFLNDTCPALREKFPQCIGELVEDNDSPNEPKRVTYAEDDSDFEEYESDHEGVDEDEILDELEAEDLIRDEADIPEDDDGDIIFVDLPQTVIGSDMATSATVKVKDDADTLDEQWMDVDASDEETTSIRTQVDVIRHSKIFHITGAAGRTWESFLFYLHTGEVDFAPLSSAKNEARKAYIKEKAMLSQKKAPPCSCKSMYRLAVMLDMEELKNLSLRFLTWQINSHTIVSEIFSDFTSRYEQVKEMELSYLVNHWDEINGSEAFLKKLSNLAAGDYPHAGEIMAEIFAKLPVEKAMN